MVDYGQGVDRNIFQLYGFCLSIAYLIARRRHPYIESLPTLWLRPGSWKKHFFGICTGKFKLKHLLDFQVVYTERRKLGTEYEIKIFKHFPEYLLIGGAYLINPEYF